MYEKADREGKERKNERTNSMKKKGWVKRNGKGKKIEGEKGEARKTTKGGRGMKKKETGKGMRKKPSGNGDNMRYKMMK